MTRKKREFLKAYDNTLGNVSSACRMAGIARSTYYEWVKSDKDFRERIDEIREGTRDFAESLLLKRMRDEDTTAIIFYLKTQCKDRGYVERVEATGANGTPLVAPPVPMSKEQAQEYLRQLESE